jgi:DNA-binding transcriptional ArsR family regulator
MTTPPAKAAAISWRHLVTALSDKTRWRIFAELVKSEPLPVAELSRRLGVPATNISKHMNLLRRFRIVERGLGSFTGFRLSFWFQARTPWILARQCCDSIEWNRGN